MKFSSFWTTVCLLSSSIAFSQQEQTAAGMLAELKASYEKGHVPTAATLSGIFLETKDVSMRDDRADAEPLGLLSYGDSAYRWTLRFFRNSAQSLEVRTNMEDSFIETVPVISTATEISFTIDPSTSYDLMVSEQKCRITLNGNLVCIDKSGTEAAEFKRLIK